MAKISLDMLFKRQRRMRYLTILALFVVSIVFGQMILFQGEKSTKAVGENGDNPYVINQSGFIWTTSAGDSYYVKRNTGNVAGDTDRDADGHTNAGTGCSVRYIATGLIVDTNNNASDGSGDNCYTVRANGRTGGDYDNVNTNRDGNKLNGRHVQIDGHVVVTMWGTTANLASFTLSSGAVVTHAPLVYMVGHGLGYDFESSLFLSGDKTSYFNESNKDYLAYDPNVTYDPNVNPKQHPNPHQYTVGYTPGYYMAAAGEKDFNVNTGAITTTGAKKVVDIRADSIQILDGQINVMGRGYPGANGNTHDDSWLDLRFTDYNSNGEIYAVPTGLPLNYGGAGGWRASCAQGDSQGVFGGGGSGFSGSGTNAFTHMTVINSVVQKFCDPCNNSCATKSYSAATLQYGDVTDPTSGLLYGPGGGGSGRYDIAVDRGGSGGGTINLTVADTGEIELHSASVLNASGQNGIDSAGTNLWGGGGGAGGTIFLNGHVKLVDNLNKTNVQGGFLTGSSGSLLKRDFGAPTFTVESTLPLAATILSRGGIGDLGPGGSLCTSPGTFCGGGGGGGAIVFDGSINQGCTITANDSGNIPVACENQDVVIDNKTVFADTYRILQDNTSFGQKGEECSRVGSERNSNYGDTACDTTRNLNSLTIRNNGVLTHSPVTIADFGGNTADHSQSLIDTVPGRWKKVDIETTGDITLQTGGKIDVTGKGYPGGILEEQNNNYIRGNGYGPGHGNYNILGGSENNYASGGGYGGVGGKGNLSVVGGGTYSNANLSLFEFGSGGGASEEGRGSSANRLTNGGNGGGRIKLTSNTLSISDTARIIANGTGGQVAGYAHSGGGSGGSIWIEVTANTAMNLGPSADGATTYGAQNGTITIRNVQTTGNNNALAVGGIGVDPNYSGGGGGRILIQRVDLSGATIRKVLKPIDRPDGGAVDANFNPYSLRLYDRIQVELTITGLIPGMPATITDDLLKITNGSVSCKSPAAVAKAGGEMSFPDNSMVWQFNPILGDEVQIAYQCVIK